MTTTAPVVLTLTHPFGFRVRLEPIGDGKACIIHADGAPSRTEPRPASDVAEWYLYKGYTLA